MTISFTVNGQPKTTDDGGMMLVDYLHDELNLTGTKFCCGMGVCRACTVSVRKPPSMVATPVISCSTALAALDGAEITTVEAVAEGGKLAAIQEAFLRHFSFQCGYCTPGFVMASKIFLDRLAVTDIKPEQLDAAIDDAIGSHICRCTGYVRYYAALKETALAVIEAKGVSR